MRFSQLGHSDDPLHVDARGVDLVGIERARLDELLDLGDGDRAAAAIIGLKLRAVRRYTRLPARSPRHAFTTAKSAWRARSSR